MRKVCTVAFTLLLAASFVAAYAYLIIQVGNESTKGTDVGLLAVAVLLVAYLIWLYIAGNAAPPEGQSGRKTWSNFKKTAVALLLCVPAALMFVGMLAPPFIIAVSALGLVVKVARQGHSET